MKTKTALKPSSILHPSSSLLSATEVLNRRVVVAGLGRFGGGVGVARWLVEQGAIVTVTDASSRTSLAESVAQLEGLPIAFKFDHQDPADFATADLIVANPAILPGTPMLQAAAAAGVAVTTEMCLFVERCPAPVFGVTGTKGKSTTTTLLGRMLTTKAVTWVGGNIGKSLLSNLPNIAFSDFVVLELSSFMLHYLGLRRWSPHVAVVTLLSSDHIDWHGSVESYVDAKKNILRFQTVDDVAVLSAVHAPTAAMHHETRARKIFFGHDTAERFRLGIAGEHNQLNAQAAFAAASTAGVTFAEAQRAIDDFHGLPHRLQRVHEHGGVSYVNDSIATIPEAAVAALNSFPPKTVIQIVGGSKKKDPPIEDFCLALAGRAKAVLCIGETGPKLAKHLATLGFNAEQPVTLDAAMATARSLAASGDTVLLSPGYASYDQYTNFEKRGEAFERISRVI